MEHWITQANRIEIIQLLDKRCNSFLVRKDGLAVLVDTSIGKESKLLLTRLEELGVDALHGILLTHVHFDHVGNAHLLQNQFGCPVFIHSSEKQYLMEGCTRLPEGTWPVTKLITSIVGDRVLRGHRFPVCSGTILTKQSDDLAVGFGSFTSALAQLCIQCFCTPGHTKGSMSYTVDDEVALVGDTMVNFSGRDVFPPFANQPELLPESWKMLLDTNCTSFLPAHGRRIDRELLKRSFSKIVARF